MALSLLFLLYGFGFLGALGLFYLLKVPFNWFNVAMALLLIVFVGNHLFLLFMVGLGILFIKHKVFPGSENKTDGNDNQKV